MAIHPGFAELILSGTKRVEFRKRRPTAKLSHVVIYATDPIRAVVGVFEVAGVVEGTPHQLWRWYRRVAGIESRAFWGYFRGCAQGVALEVGQVFALDAPLPLEQIAPRVGPPRSFRYLPSGILVRIACQTTNSRRHPDASRL